VISDGGWAGAFYGQPSLDLALIKATAACVSRAGPFDPCRVVYVDETPRGTWKK
jgi:hypothetical protein